MARSGCTERVVAAWSSVLESLSPPCRSGGGRPPAFDRAQIDRMLGDGSLSGAAIDQAGRLLAVEGLSWEGLDEFNALRRELCAMDVRFGELGAGVFESLDRQAVIDDHRIVTEAEIDSAGAAAPARTRAAIRGRWVDKLAGQHDRYVCDWNGIFGAGVRLDLSDPFAATGKWENAREP